jgi:hypothetical protein
LVNVNTASGMALPLGSVTVPLSEVVDCASKAGGKARSNNPKQETTEQKPFRMVTLRLV